ncbi:MAG TPA: DUF2726 domain-containing protein [Nitrospira sp.]|nr:DUF2726 domain-containing protein [Nitrospira sp.]
MKDGSIDSWFIGLVVGLLALLLWRIVGAGSSKAITSGQFTLPSGVTLRPQVLLSDAELLLYNLIRMAVQDRYLVFAQVPLWRILAVEAQGGLRTQVLRHLALKRVDFVLVHPGSRLVEQVVQLEEGPWADPEGKARSREIQRMVQAAGIRMTTLNAESNYTVTQLEQLFGVSEPE